MCVHQIAGKVTDRPVESSARMMTFTTCPTAHPISASRPAEGDFSAQLVENRSRRSRPTRALGVGEKPARVKPTVDLLSPLAQIPFAVGYRKAGRGVSSGWRSTAERRISHSSSPGRPFTSRWTFFGSEHLSQASRNRRTRTGGGAPHAGRAGQFAKAPAERASLLHDSYM